VSATGRAWVLAGGLCALVVGADQAIKAIVEASLTTGEQVEVLGPIGLTLSHNRGVAFGLAGGAGAPLILVGLAALGVVAYVFSRDPTRPGMWVAAGLLAGGAIGNLLDRIASDAVTDYIDIGSWPAFNLADVAITVGIVLLVLLFLREPEREPAGDG
jgi:signal peptidase II